MSNLILAEFKGSYRSPHPQGYKDQNIERQFHVKVKMKRDSLNAPGLNGLFATYYASFLKNIFPDFLELYMFSLVEATELDGTPIRNPKCLSHAGLLQYIQDERIPINPLLYGDTTELRNQVVLYQVDSKGQQVLQEKIQKTKGQMLATAEELATIDDIVTVVGQEPAPVAPIAAPPAPPATPNPVEPVKEPAPPAPPEQKATASAIDELLAKKGGKSAGKGAAAKATAAAK